MVGDNVETRKTTQAADHNVDIFNYASACSCGNGRNVAGMYFLFICLSSKFGDWPPAARMQTRVDTLPLSVLITAYSNIFF
jgi:hypothetical protein